MHGLRHPLLSSGVSARQPDSRLERSRLSRSLARGDRSVARDEQLPRVHRTALPGAVRGRVRARHQQRSGHDQVDRGLDYRARVRRRLGHRPSARHSHRQAGRRRRIGAGRPGGRRPAEPRRALGDGVRACRSHRRADALRHSRVQDGEAVPRPPPRHHAGRRRDVPHQRERRRRRLDRRAAPTTSTRSCSRAARPRRAICRCPAASWTASISRWSICRCRTGAMPATRCRTIEFITAKDKHVIIIGGGDTGADCLGTAHRQGARSVHQLELLHAAARRPRREQPVAALAEHLPRVVRARRRRRTRLRGVDRAIHRRATAASPSCTARRSRSAAGTAASRSRRCPAAHSRSTPISCCWRWDFSDPNAAACSTRSGSR